MLGALDIAAEAAAAGARGVTAADGRNGAD